METSNTATITINGEVYALNTTLRAAYAIQTRFGHKPYMEIFKNFDSLNLEDQITILYESWKLANPTVGLSRNDFMAYILDNYGVIELFDLVGEVTQRIMYGGLTEEEVEAKKAKARQRNLEQ